MLYTEEFIKQWDECSKILSSLIRNRLMDSRPVSETEINEILSKERDRWFNSSQYQGMWLNKLRNHNEAIGTAFELKLKEIKLYPVKNPPESSFAPYLVISAVIGIFLFIITGNLNLAQFFRIPITIIIPISLLGFFNTTWKGMNKDKRLSCRTLYLQQLEPYKLELVKLCEKADAK